MFTGLDDIRAQIGPITPRTAFEAWAIDRARPKIFGLLTLRVERGLGYEDLDDYGEWFTSRLRLVWRPLYLGYDWAPYRLRPLGLDPSLGLDLGR